MPVLGDQTTALSPAKTLVINDWTAGIVSQDYSTFLGFGFNSFPVPNTGQKVTSSINTYGVTGLPNGGLLLGPQLVATVSIGAIPNNSFPAVTGMLWKQSKASPIIYFVLGYNDNSGHTVQALYLLNTNATFTLQHAFTGGNATARLLSASFPFSAFMNSGSTFVECIGLNCNPGPIDTTSAVPYIYSTGSPTTGDFCSSTSTSRFGLAVPFGGRVWYFETSNTTNQTYPLQGEPEFISISYTNPTLVVNAAANLSINSAQTLVDYNNINSYGAWGELVSGEVVLVKMTGGGVIVSGDIFSPNVTRVPSVQSTNGLFGQGCITPIGLVYRSLNNGVWAWQGGEAAIKISNQLADSNWIEAAGISTDVNFTELNALTPFTGAYFYNMVQFGNFILTDSGLFYDMTTNAWWRLPPYVTGGAINNISSQPQVCKFFAPLTSAWAAGSAFPSNSDFTSVWADTVTGSGQIKQSVWSFDTSNINPYTSFPTDPFNPNFTFYNCFWESNPIQFPDDPWIEIQEIDIQMTGNGTLYVGVRGSSHDVQLGSGYPAVVNAFYSGTVRIPVSIQTTSVNLQIAFNQNPSGDSDSAPMVIESVKVHYRERFPVAVAAV